MKETYKLNVLKQRCPFPIISISGIIGEISLMFADVKTENIHLRSQNWLKKKSEISLPSGQPTCWSENQKLLDLFVSDPYREKNIYALIKAQSAMNLSLTSADSTVACRRCTLVRTLFRANIFTSATNLQRYIIWDCVFIVCNVYISLQLFAHINKRFN